MSYPSGMVRDVTNPQPIAMDYLTYLSSLIVDPNTVISRVSQMGGAGLYKITDDHYVCIQCEACDEKHNGRALLEKVLPRTWEMFYSAINEGEFSATHYGPVA